MKKAVFFDKDGTLVRDVPFNVNPDMIELVPGALEALGAASRAGYGVFIVTNQPGFALGFFTETEFRAAMGRLNALIARSGVTVQGMYFCPHARDAACSCRKPRPGLLMRAAREHGVDLAASWMVGDILDDVEAGRTAGCRTVLVDNGHETEWKTGAMRQPDYRVTSLAEVGGLLAA